MAHTRLVPVDKYSDRIKTLSIFKRIEIDHPILVRDAVAKRLAKIAKKLPGNLKLQVDSGYRSKELQEKLWKSRLKQFKSRKKTRNLVFDPSTGIPPHSTGGAVDLTLQNERGKEINLSEPFEKYYREPQLKSNKITKRAQELRVLLNKLLLNENFAPNPREYWHFSYGERAWARYYKKTPKYTMVKESETSQFLYGSILRYILRFLRLFYKLLNSLFKIDTSY